MRLFIAIEFSEQIKAELKQSAALVRKVVPFGRFSPIENYHLTLVFLGEVPESQLEFITAAMDECGSSAFTITIGHLGRFKQNRGDIIWRSIEGPEELFLLQSALSNSLRDKGFMLEDRAYKPHLTLARDAVLKDGVKLRDLSEQLPDLTQPVRRITLMRSDHVQGRQRYTPIYHKKMDPKTGDNQ